MAGADSFAVGFDFHFWFLSQFSSASLEKFPSARKDILVIFLLNKIV
jgi:hypothetical protein